MSRKEKINKYLILGILFILPVTAYLFFASGVNHFARLPILVSNVGEVSDFSGEGEEKVELKNHISILSFLGSDLESNYANAFNIAHKIYTKNHGFEDFQFVTIMPEGTQDQVEKLKLKIAEIADLQQWKFIYGDPEEIQFFFDSLQIGYHLDQFSSTPFVFIVDKNRNLRGRNDDDIKRYGYDSSNYSEINNELGDDVKVILAEYRLELKKYKSDRAI